MDKRYQVFISSTFTDLKEERRAIIQTLLNAKFIPAGMELFSASNDEQFKYIKKIIDTCDYYVLIVGARYGTINPSTGMSFTEQEYDYAVLKNIPVLAFLHEDPYNLPIERREDDKRDLLDAFRLKVSDNRLCRMWNNHSELVTSVLISLTEIVSENPQLGWTRGSTYDATELLSQINDLRVEKEKLEKEILILKATIKLNNSKIEYLADGNEKFTLRGKKSRYTGSGYTYEDYEANLTWDEIFSAVGPYLVSSKSYGSFEIDLKNGINSAYNKVFNSINDDCAQTIKIQLNALGLINVNASQAVSGGIAEFIVLTQKGKDYLLNIKAIRKEK